MPHIQIINSTEIIDYLNCEDDIWNQYDCLIINEMIPFTKYPEIIDILGEFVTMTIKHSEVNEKNVYLVNPSDITEENYSTI